MNFTQLNLETKAIENLNSLGFYELTDIQEKVLPHILEKKDIIAQAKTGSGKTIAFSLAVLNNFNKDLYNIQSLILAPTRELATQIAQTLKDIFRFIPNVKISLLCGGLPYKPQVHSLKHKAHIVVGTPGRIYKHLENNNFETKYINTLVLDEADRMLDMGFYDDIIKIIEYLPKKRETLLFSATYLNSIEELSQTITNNAIFIKVASNHSQTTIKQLFYNTKNYNDQKYKLIPKLFNKNINSVLIFCNMKIECDNLADLLEEEYDMEPLVLHSDMEQKYRDETLVLFSNKSYPILISTNLAARGLDIDDIDLIINYNLPEDLANYTHRIGRTARANKNGIAISFIDAINQFNELKNSIDSNINLLSTKELEDKEDIILEYCYSTLYINGGKKHKLRAGDILGALTAGCGLEKDSIGKINIFPTCSYVAIKNQDYEKAYTYLKNHKMKNKLFMVYKR